MPKEPDSLLINAITARPEAVYLILRGVQFCHNANHSAEATSLRDLLADDMGDAAWADNLRAAETLGALTSSMELLWDVTSAEDFKSRARRRFIEFEATAGVNSLLPRAYRVALGMSIDPTRGGLRLGDLTEAVNSSGGRRSTGVREFNEEKGRSWIEWMRYCGLIVGSAAGFMPTLLSIMRGVARSNAIVAGRELPLRSFLQVVEEEAPCTVEPATSVPSGTLPLATAAALELLEAEGVLRLATVPDARERWEFPETRQGVTHVERFDGT